MMTHTTLSILDVRQLADDGIYREYQTMAGWRPLSHFDAYGMAPADPARNLPAGVNWGPRYSQPAFRLTSDVNGAPCLVDVPARPDAPGNVLAVFPLR